MRIASIEAIPASNACYARVVSEDGATGVGESTFFGWPTAVAEIIRSIGASLEGRDAFDVEHHWLALYRSVSLSGHGGDRRHQRRRPGAVGSQGQALRSTSLAAAGRPSPPGGPRDEGHRRRFNRRARSGGTPRR